MIGSLFFWLLQQYMGRQGPGSRFPGSNVWESPLQQKSFPFSNPFQAPFAFPPWMWKVAESMFSQGFPHIGAFKGAFPFSFFPPAHLWGKKPPSYPPPMGMGAFAPVADQGGQEKILTKKRGSEKQRKKRKK